MRVRRCVHHAIKHMFHHWIYDQNCIGLSVGNNTTNCIITLVDRTLLFVVHTHTHQAHQKTVWLTMMQVTHTAHRAPGFAKTGDRVL